MRVKALSSLSLILLFFSICIALSSDPAGAEDHAEKVFGSSVYHDSVWESRYCTSFNFQISSGTGVYRDCDKDKIGVIGDCSSNIGVYQMVKGKNVAGGQDYGTMTATSHKIYIPSTKSPFTYTITLSTDYKCDYWQTDSNTVIRSYFKISGYSSSDTLISSSSKQYVAHYNTFSTERISPDDDGDLHSGGSVTYTISGSSVSYIKIIFVTEGSWLYSVDGIEILYTNIDVNYKLFSGFDFTKGDSQVTVSRSFPGDGLISLGLYNGGNNGLDYGTVTAKTPYLYFNNEAGSIKNHVGSFKIDYNRQYWSVGTTVFRAYFKIHYYDSSLNLLGTDTKIFVDYNTASPPYSYIAPGSSGTVTISNPTDYSAKYIRAEILMTGSWLYLTDGAGLKFSNFKLRGGDANLETVYYYESDYDGSDDDIPAVEWYLINYKLTEDYDNRLMVFRHLIDDAVDSSEFDGTNSDDIRANDFAIYTGHGARGYWDNYMYLTRDEDIDDDDIGNWGPETEIVCLLCCDIFGDTVWEGNQRGEWAVHGLYYNHGVLSFTDEMGVSYSEIYDFLDELVSGTTFALSFERAFASDPWASIWDESWQANSDHLWDVDDYSSGMSSDESSDDSTYYERVKS